MNVARPRYALLIALAWLLGMLFFASFVIAFSVNDTFISPATMWTPVFTDTFDVLLPVWTLTADSGYGWGVTPYTRSLGTVVFGDYGLWSAGGGTLGSAQTWPTGTYTNAMDVWGIAGPFTPTQKVWEMRLQLDLQNRVASGDTLFFGLSNGPHNEFKGLTVSEFSSEWQTLSWSTKEFGQSPVWIALRFVSDGQNVAAGSLVDNLVLEFNYGSTVYLPLVQRDPTPTPTPTPTPMPIYVDDFDDSNSGWHTGVAMRYSEWCRWGWDCHAGDEEVAYISYGPGYYRYWIPMTWQGGGDVNTWYVWPAEKAPLPDAFYPLPERYCIEARGRLANSWEDYQPWWAHWGIVFGANESMTELFTFQVNANHDYSVFQLHNYEYPGDHQPKTGEEINVEIPILPWTGDDLSLIPTAPYNILKVAVRRDMLDVYVNDVKLKTIFIGNIPRENIGLIGGSWEVTPVELWFDYFRYDSTCPEAQR